nr:hypothetical protein [Tessaracoccus bendigoensis]
MTAPQPEASTLMSTQTLGASQVLGTIHVPASGVAYWRSVWSRRHTLALAVGGVALLALLVSAREPQAGIDYLLLGVAAVLGAVTLATYVPPVGVPAREHLTGGACGAIPVLAVVGAPVMLSQADATPLPLVALLASYGLAVGKRITDHASC